MLSRLKRILVRRPILACVASIACVVAGVLAAVRLPVAYSPRVTPSSVVVTATFPGAGAQEVASAVAAVIEPEVSGTPGRLDMSSKSSDSGRYELVIDFPPGADVETAAAWVQRRVELAQPRLPEEVRRQGVRVEKRSRQALLLVSLFSPKGTRDIACLRDFAATRIKRTLDRIPGVGKVELLGLNDYALRIRPDSAEACSNLGNALVQAGRVQKAIEYWQQALQINPDLAETHYNLGLALEGLGRKPEAIQQYEEALRIKPDFVQAQTALARVRSHSKND